MFIHWLIKRTICLILDHKWKKGKFGFTNRGTYQMNWYCERCHKPMVKECWPGMELPASDDGMGGL